MLTRLLILISITWLGTKHATGQQYSQERLRSYEVRPTVSPYLRLAPVLTADNQLQYIDGAYQAYVRPQIQQREAIQQQQSQIIQLRNQFKHAQKASPSSQLLQTGHHSRFQSYSHFYPHLGTQKR